MAAAEPPKIFFSVGAAPVAAKICGRSSKSGRFLGVNRREEFAASVAESRRLHNIFFILLLSCVFRLIHINQRWVGHPSPLYDSLAGPSLLTLFPHFPGFSKNQILHRNHFRKDWQVRSSSWFGDGLGLRMEC